MSKYTNKKHGMILGSEPNSFFINRNGNGAHTYGAIISFYGYRFDNYLYRNIAIKTPLQQLLYDFEYDHTEFREYAILSNNIIYWLDANIGERELEWDTYDKNFINDCTIFFKKRSSALKFIKFIDHALDGMQFNT